MAPARTEKQDVACTQKGVVALLQEFVQCSRQFAAPQHRAILQWTYDNRIANQTSLEFRGTVAFLLDGLPHHVAGGWQPSKKHAQRDVAERALAFFVGKWGEQLLEDEADQSLAPLSHSRMSDLQMLDSFCSSYKACAGCTPKWSYSMVDGDCIAQAEIMLLGVPHKFAGAPKPSKSEAEVDAARRILWYFQCPGYQHFFSLNANAPAVTGKEIPPPPENWACSSAEIEDLRRAERKTVLMRVQNRLQQELAKQLKPGQGVWDWSYEADENDLVWPPLYRATVVIPALQKSFVGEWARGQREAQIEASYVVADFLDGDRETLPPASSSEEDSAGSSVADSEESSERSAVWVHESEGSSTRCMRWADIDDDEDVFDLKIQDVPREVGKGFGVDRLALAGDCSQHSAWGR